MANIQITLPQQLVNFRPRWLGDIFPALLALAIIGMVGAPLVVLGISSFRPETAMPFDNVGWTTENAQAVFLEASTYTLLKNTFAYAAGSLALALPLAFTLAWLVERTDLPFRKFLYTLMFVPMVIPTFAIAIAYIFLLNPSNGLFNTYIKEIFSLDLIRGPFNIYSLWGMIFVTGMLSVPSMWLMLLPLFRNSDPRMEEAAAASGAGRFQTLRRITAPLMAPGLLAVLVYFTVIYIEVFEIPLALGLTANYPVLSTKIFLLVNAEELGEVAYSIAAAFGMLFVIIGAVLMFFYLFSVRLSEKFAVVTGKGFQPKIIKLGTWKYVAVGAIGIYFALAVLFPFLILLWTSLLPFYTTPSFAAFSDLNISNYTKIFGQREFLLALKNTFVVGIASATISMLLASVISWTVVRRAGWLSRSLSVFSFIPLTIPTVVLALAILLLYANTPIHGTLFIIILAFSTRYLAFTTRLMHAAQLQIEKSLEEAALVSGAGSVTAFFKINLALLLPAVVNGWVWVVAHSVRDFIIPLFMATASTIMLANLIFQAVAAGRPGLYSSYMVVLIVIVVVIAFVARWKFGGQLGGTR
jgi:iron(III) transport system permease protein